MCFQVNLDLFSSVGPRLVLHTPCGAVQWIYIVGEEYPGQRAGRIDGTIGPRFSLPLCMLLQYVLTKTGQM